MPGQERLPNRCGVQLRDPGVSKFSHGKMVAVDRRPIPLSSLPGYHPPSPRGQSRFARPPPPAFASASARPPRGQSVHPVQKGFSPRPGDIVQLSNSPRSGQKVHRLPPPAPRPMPIPPSNVHHPLPSIRDVRQVALSPDVVRQSRLGPRITPAPRAGIQHVSSFRATVSNVPSIPKPQRGKRNEELGRADGRSTVGRKSTIRGPRPAPTPTAASASAPSHGTLQRRRAVSRTSRLSRTSTSSSASRPLPAPPPPPPPHRSPHILALGEEMEMDEDGESDSGTDPSSPLLTLQWFPDPEKKRTGSVDQAEETWAKMEHRMRQRLRDSRRERGRWIVTPRLPSVTQTPLVGGVGFPQAVPTGSRRGSEDVDPRREMERYALQVELQPQHLEDHPNVDNPPSPSASHKSGWSEFTLSAYLDEPPLPSSRCSSASASVSASPPILEGMTGVAMFDMTQPLISRGIDKTPMNTPNLHTDTLRRTGPVSKRPELAVEYLGGGGMLVRDESLRSVVSRADALTKRAVGLPVKVAQEVEGGRLDPHVRDALSALASGEVTEPPTRCASPLEELIVNYVSSPPIAVQWAPPPMPRLPPLPPHRVEDQPIPTPRSIASVALDEMIDFLNHNQPTFRPLRGAQSPKPQYTNRIYGSPESVVLPPPPLPLAPLPRPLEAQGSPNGLGLGMNIRLDSVYGVPSIASARVKLLPPRADDSLDSIPLPFATSSPRHSPALDFCPADEEEIQSLVITDLDTGKAINIDLDLAPSLSPLPVPEIGGNQKERKWWSKKLFGK